MLLIVQILLTVQAWLNGWRAWALLPVVIDLMVGFLVGCVVNDVSQAIVPCLLSGLLSTGALIVLVNRSPQPVPVPAKPEVMAF